MDWRFVASITICILLHTVSVRGSSPTAIRHVNLSAEQGRKTLSTPAYIPASERTIEATLNNDCDDEVQQIACYYDIARSAIVGVQYTLRNSRAKRRVCNTSGQPGNTVRLRRGVGVTKLTVRSTSDKVVAIEFQLSNGRTSSCKVINRAANQGASSSGDEASATTAFSSTASPSTIVGDYLADYPYKIGGGDQPPSSPPNPTDPPRPPIPPSPRPPHRSRVYAGPSAAYHLAGLSGVCSNSGNFADRLQAVTQPCWIKTASQPSPSPSPDVPPRPSPPPSTKPPLSPSPRPPKPFPSPSPSPKPSQGPNGQLSVTLYSRGQTSCGTLSPDAVQDLVWYLGKQLLLLGLGEYFVKQDGSACPCSVVQGVPMYACRYLVQGPSSSQWDGPAAASYLAASVTAAGQQICTGAVATNLTTVCSSSAQVTGLCAAATTTSSSTLSCAVTPGPSPWQMTVLLGVPTATCSSNVSMTDDGVGSLVQYLSGYLPGYTVTVPTGATTPLKCSSAQANAYYQIPAVTISPRSQLDVHGAAEFLSATLNQQQPGPCSGSSSTASSSKPTFCTQLPQLPVMCATANYSLTAVTTGCPSAGSSFSVLFTNPSDSCGQGNPPPDAIRSSLDVWWRQQLDYLANGKLFNATTVPPGSVTASNGSCLYRYRVMVYGPNSWTAQQIDDMALGLMSSALMFKPVPCTMWQGADFCKYFAAATFCAALAPAIC